MLVVDDEQDLLHAVEGLLEDEGFDVVACSTGREALDYLANAHPALVILDVMMPYISGYEVLDGIRSSAALHDIPVVLMSAAGVRADRAAQCQAFLRKPFSVDELMGAVGALVHPAA